jgi:hypothetical protein
MNMRIIRIQLDYDKDNRDADDLDDSDEAIEQALREEENRRKHFMAQEKFERTHYDARAHELLPIIDNQLAAFELEVVQFDDGSDDFMWRIERRDSQG